MDGHFKTFEDFCLMKILRLMKLIKLSCLIISLVNNMNTSDWNLLYTRGCLVCRIPMNEGIGMTNSIQLIGLHMEYYWIPQFMDIIFSLCIWWNSNPFQPILFRKIKLMRKKNLTNIYVFNISTTLTAAPIFITIAAATSTTINDIINFIFI